MDWDDEIWWRRRKYDNEAMVVRREDKGKNETEIVKCRCDGKGHV